VGLSYRFRWANVKPDSLDSQLATSGLRGVGTSWMSGFGAVASWDSRDHVYIPTRGMLARLSAEWYSRLLGSSYDFGLVSAEVRAYQGLGKGYSVAGQFKMSSMLGSGPFREHPGVGEVLRGYGSTRHVGKNRWAAQIEFRAIPVVWRLGFVVFAGVGDVARRLDGFDGDLWYTVGFGVRFLAYRSLKITIRQDFGFGRNSSGDYLDLNEAF
jgi:outer membrane protein assembly factor BamA